MAENARQAQSKLVADYMKVLYSVHYKDVPVRPEQFFKDPYYLGRVTSEGKRIYQGWWPIIDKVLASDQRYIVVFTGGTSLGKTLIAVYCMAYCLYRVMCLRDRNMFFELANTGKYAVSFFNLVKSLQGSKGYRVMQETLLNSPWFLEHGGVPRGDKEKYIDLPDFRWAHSSPAAAGFGIQGEDVVCGLLDEVDSPHESAGSRKRVLNAWTSTYRRFEGRFAKSGPSLSRLFMVSSKQDETAFLEAFIEEMRESPRVQIYDMARWDIMPHKDYSGATFSVLVGDSYMPSRILHPTEVTEIIKQGYKTIDVPIEYEHDFSIDVVGALRDIAGLTVAGSRKYKLFPSQKFIKFDDTKQDPVAMDTIITGLNDMRRWISLIDLNKLRVPLDVQRFGHFDFAISGDAAAIAFSCIKGWTTGSTVDEAGLVTETQVPVVETDMVVRIKAAPDDRIPLSSVRQLILDLRSAGLRIGYFSYDLLVGSEDTKQILNKAGVAGDHFSVDKDTKAYLCFRDMVFEERWVCHPHPWVAFEMAEIEHNREKNKIDHPDRVTKVQIIDGQVKKHVVDGSKDCLDAIVASVYHAVMRASPVASVAEVREGLAGLKKGHMKREDWFMKTIVPDVSAEDRQELESAGDSVEEVRDALAGLKARRAMRQRGKGYGFF